MEAVRSRKACLNCYAKKVRCDFRPEVKICSRCQQQGLECVLPDGAPDKPRSSIRSTLEDLHSRVRSLEGTSGIRRPSSEQSPGDMAYADAATTRWNSNLLEISQTNQEMGQDRISGDQSILTTTGYRGTTSPWTALVSGTSPSFGSESMRSFQETAERLAEEDSLSKNRAPIQFDILREFPFLARENIYFYAKNYAEAAPFPILHWENFRNSLDLILRTRHAVRSGQVVCILLYIGFGSAHTQGNESSTRPHYGDSGMLFKRAWALLPDLLLEHDLWALKAVTLLAHYLQGSSTPEPCWTILGTALRMAISLGFHREKVKLHNYSVIEREEGIRAFWLCYIMEKTLAVVFGRPSSVSGIDPQTPLPELFPAYPMEPDGQEQRDEVESFRVLDVTAVEFYKELINLSKIRDSILGALPNAGAKLSQDPSFESPDYLRAASSELKKLVQRNARLDFQIRPDSSLRETISDLTHYNAIQIIDSHLYAGHSFEGVRAARTTIQIILEAKSEAWKALCLWMWLYYAFTSIVVLFLHFAHDPLHAEATFDMALISDVRALCTTLSSKSEGAKRLVEVTAAMDGVAFELMKSAAKIKARKRRQEGEELGPEKQRRLNDEVFNLGDAATGVDPLLIRPEDYMPALENNAITTEGPLAEDVEPAWNELFNTAPTNFSWDEWDQWLEDVPH